MREIKFRGKSLMEGSEGKWIYSNSMIFNAGEIMLAQSYDAEDDVYCYVDINTVRTIYRLKR